jgi:capsular exopolysaccharide synthesis family protein
MSTGSIELTPVPTGVPDTNDVGKGVTAAAAGEQTFLERTRVTTCNVDAQCPVFPFEDHHGGAAEQYRLLRTKVTHHRKRPGVIAVSSPQAGDGKSTTALNLAGVLALKRESAVLLVDADMRRSSIAGMLGLPAAAGLADVLANRVALEDAIVRPDVLPDLHVLPAGDRMTHNAAELLDSDRWSGLCARLRSQFTFIVVDVPPVGILADYDLIQAQCDAVLLVVRPDHTDRTICSKALEVIAPDRLLGVVVNSLSDTFLSGSKAYRYESPYSRGQQDSSKPRRNIAKLFGLLK